MIRYQLLKNNLLNIGQELKVNDKGYFTCSNHFDCNLLKISHKVNRSYLKLKREDGF